MLLSTATTTTVTQHSGPLAQIENCTYRLVDAWALLAKAGQAWMVAMETQLALQVYIPAECIRLVLQPVLMGH